MIVNVINEHVKMASLTLLPVVLMITDVILLIQIFNLLICIFHTLFSHVTSLSHLHMYGSFPAAHATSKLPIRFRYPTTAQALQLHYHTYIKTHTHVTPSLHNPALRGTDPRTNYIPATTRTHKPQFQSARIHNSPRNRPRHRKWTNHVRNEITSRSKCTHNYHSSRDDLNTRITQCTTNNISDDRGRL